jgi:hypothetical protein
VYGIWLRALPVVSKRKVTSKGFVEVLEQAITSELSVEDRVNAEVRQLLKAYEEQIDRGQVDYQKMFQMVKQKLVRERGIIL